MKPVQKLKTPVIVCLLAICGGLSAHHLYGYIQSKTFQNALQQKVTEHSLPSPVTVVIPDKGTNVRFSGPFPLNELTAFEWDSVCILKGENDDYAPAEPIHIYKLIQERGFEYGEPTRRLPDIFKRYWFGNEYDTALLFIHNNHVIKIYQDVSEGIDINGRYYRIRGYSCSKSNGVNVEAIEIGPRKISHRNSPPSMSTPHLAINIYEQ